MNAAFKSIVIEHVHPGPANRIALTPDEPAAIFAVRRWIRREQDSDYYF